MPYLAQKKVYLLKKSGRDDDSQSSNSDVDDLQPSDPQYIPQADDEPVADPVNNPENKEQPISKSRKVKCSPTVLICISHAMSAWGDRMWAFAVSVFLIALTPDSFLLTAVYGLSVSLSVVAFGTLVGDWIDVTPRLKAVRLTLIIQNVAVVACATVVLIMFKLKTSIVPFIIFAVVLTILAIVARLSGLGTTISIERDWVIVIARENSSLLAGTNSTLRRIDLTCNILAPVLTGLILYASSTLVGVFFIAGWNLLSLFAEYFLLSCVYHSCPALANKAIDTDRLNGPVSEEKPDGDYASGTDRFNGPDGKEEPDGDFASGIQYNGDRSVLLPSIKTAQRSGIILIVEKLKSRLRILRIGLKLYFQQRVAFAGVGLACLYLTVLGFDSITTAYAYSQHVKPFVLGILTAAGALTGIFGTFLFPKFRNCFGLVKTGVISNSVQLFFLMFCAASVWAPGHPGHLLDPGYHDHHDNNVKTMSLQLINTSSLPMKKFSSTVNTVPFNVTSPQSIARSKATVYANVSFSVLSSNSFNLSPSTGIFPSKTSSVPTGNSITNLTVNVNVMGNTTRRNSGETSAHKDDVSSRVSLALLMGGIVMSRIGLWMTDLTITQLFQENIREQERGIVSGVQNSFNSIMDVAHFIMVILAPKPEYFGILVLISVAMVSLGLAFYCRFAWNQRKRSNHLEKLSQWSASAESVEGSSRQLRDDSRSNSQDDFIHRAISTDSENFSSSS